MRAWRLVFDIVPPGCRARNVDYGSPGWLRLFPQEIVRDPEVHMLIWVDAGDYVFLDDPAGIVAQRSLFKPHHVAGAPLAHALPFQLYDLRRMRKANYTETIRKLVQEGYAQDGDGFCNLGEGHAVGRLTHYLPWKNQWHFFSSDWAYEPWMEWSPTMGLTDIWGGRGTAFQVVWNNRVFPGLRDFTTLLVHCPEFLEGWAHYMVYAGKPPDVSEYGVGVGIGMSYERQRLENDSFTDWKGQQLTCNMRARGTHLVLPFHFVPWVHKFLNFWAGANVWDKDHRKGRDLSKAGPGEKETNSATVGSAF